jgi:hypothetical protein
VFWKSKKKQPEWPLAGLRETLFGDLPLENWSKPGAALGAEEPWASFARARELLQSDRTAAIESLRSIANTAGLEPRHHLQAWHVLRELGVKPAQDLGKQVLGVVVEVPVGGGPDVLAAYADHSARYLNHAGGAVIWERPDDRLDALIDGLLAASSSLVQRIGPWDGPRPPPPRKEHARLNFLTPSGLHFGEGPFGALAGDPMGAPVINAATLLMKELVEIGLKKPVGP